MITKALRAGVHLICKDLSTWELSAAINIASAGWALELNHICYPSASSLFTEPGNKMHPATLECVMEEFDKRLQEESE